MISPCSRIQSPVTVRCRIGRQTDQNGTVMNDPLDQTFLPSLLLLYAIPYQLVDRLQLPHQPLDPYAIFRQKQNINIPAHSRIPTTHKPPLSTNIQIYQSQLSTDKPRNVKHTNKDHRFNSVGRSFFRTSPSLAHVRKPSLIP
jgi:hypothetical protein